jgi:hypothetical protein
MADILMEKQQNSETEARGRSLREGTVRQPGRNREARHPDDATAARRRSANLDPRGRRSRGTMAAIIAQHGRARSGRTRAAIWRASLRSSSEPSRRATSNAACSYWRIPVQTRPFESLSRSKSRSFRRLFVKPAPFTLSPCRPGGGGRVRGPGWPFLSPEGRRGALAAYNPMISFAPFCAIPGVRPRLHVEIGDAEGVGLDEVAARLDEVAHQGREGLLGRIGVADLDLQE